MSDNNLTPQTILSKYKNLLNEAEMTRGTVGKKNPIRKTLDGKIKEIKTTIDRLKEYEGDNKQSIDDMINDAGKNALMVFPPINPIELEARTQKEQEILQKYDDEADDIEKLIETSQERYNDYKAQRSTQNTNKNLGKQVLVKALIGAGQFAKTLGTAYVMATLNAGRPEAGAGAEAIMNRNNELVANGLGQLSRFNLDLDIMPMDMMGGGMIPPPQMGGMMPMPFNPMGMMGQQERPFDPMAGILQTVASALNNTSPISFGGFEPQNTHISDKKNGSLSLKIGNNTLTFPDQEAKKDFTDKYDAILGTLGTETLPTQDARHKAEQELAQLFIKTARHAIGRTKLPSEKTFVNEAKKMIEEHITENLSEPLKPFYDSGIKTDEDYTHFIHNIDAPRITAYRDALKAINDNFPDIDYKSIKEAIKNNVDDHEKSAIISHEVDEKLGNLLKKQDYDLIDTLFANNNHDNNIIPYTNKLQECAKKTQTDTIKNSKQDETIPIKIEPDGTNPNKKSISFTAKATADWVGSLFPKQELDKGFSFYGQDIEKTLDTTNKEKYKGAFAFAIADKDHATEPTLYSVKLDDNAPLSQEIYDFINKFLNDANGKSRDTKKDFRLSKEDILNFKEICLKLPFETATDENQPLRKNTIEPPVAGKDFSEFLTEKAKAQAIEMNNPLRGT